MSTSREYLIGNLDRVRLDYDRATDTLHISFGEPSEEVDEAILTEDDVGFRIKDGRVVSITIYNLLKRLGLEV
ncbi:MAG: DUF2283 domain-containing protein [Desulfurococcaceae archaeon]|nr:DUF2283 domain-containing protein [Desulfurococcaceae archaeon]